MLRFSSVSLPSFTQSVSDLVAQPEREQFTRTRSLAVKIARAFEIRLKLLAQFHRLLEIRDLDDSAIRCSHGQCGGSDVGDLLHLA